MKSQITRLGVCAAALGLLSLGHAAHAGTTIAHWAFEDGALETDSSGNGHTLTNNGAVTFSSDKAAGAPGGGSAVFDGSATSYMETVASLDLSGTLQKHIRVSWWQQVTGTSPGHIAEHTPNFNGTDGAFVLVVNGGPAGTGAVHHRYDNTPIVDEFTHASGSTTWERIVVELDLGSPTVEEAIKVFNDGVPGTSVDLSGGATPPDFVNGFLYIGARAGGTVAPYVGKIDELKIEEIPEPSSLALLGLGLAALAGCGRRRRR